MRSLAVCFRSNPVALESWEYRDPLEVAERRESQSCKGCLWLMQVHCLGQTFGRCKILPQRTELRRCQRYHALHPDR